MSTARLQQRLKKINEMEQDLHAIPTNSDNKKEKKEFLKKLHQLKKDLLQSKPDPILLQDIESLENKCTKLAEKELAIGQQILQEKLNAHLKDLPDVAVLQTKLSELAKARSLFKEIKKPSPDNKNSKSSHKHETQHGITLNKRTSL